MSSSISDPKNNKQRLRQQYRHWRLALDASAQASTARRLQLRCAGNNHFRKAQNIGFYWPNDGEPSLLPLMGMAHHLGKACYLPKVVKDKLHFLRYQPKRILQVNRFGIPEPRNTECIALTSLDLIFMPLVAFDGSGKRLGMGGGYYDRSLAELSGPRKTGRPLLIGVAHVHQQLEEGVLQTDVWDFPLDGCLTERSMLWF